MGELQQRAINIRAMEAAAMEAVISMAKLRYFPPDKLVRASIMLQLVDMAHNVGQIRELAVRMTTRYNDWPGPMEMRACFCTFAKPRDGIPADLDPLLSTQRQDAERRAVDAADKFKALPPLASQRVALLMPGASEHQQREAGREAGREIAEHEQQTAAWAQLCREYPVTRVFRSKSLEFAGASLERRREILVSIRAELDRSRLVDLVNLTRPLRRG